MMVTEFGVLCNVTNDDIKDGTFVVPEGVDSIGLWAFQNCTELKRLTVPEGVEIIDDFAFDHCTGLESIDLPKNLKDIGNFAFLYCTSLSEINIPEGVTGIGVNAFECCSNLKKVTVPDSVKTICTRAFYECESLNEISVPKTVRIQKQAFLNCPAKVKYRSIEHPKILDCALDDRFNGAVAKLKLNGEERAIDEWYYLSRRQFDGNYVDKEEPFDHLIDPFTGIKLPPEDAVDLYRGLWITYLKNEPELVGYASQFHDIVDSVKTEENKIKRQAQVTAYNKDPFNPDNEFRYKYPETLGGAEIIGAYALGNRDFYVAAVKSSHWYKTISQYKKLPLAEKILNFLEKENPVFWYTQGLPNPKSSEEWLKIIEKDLSEHHLGWYAFEIKSLGENVAACRTQAQAIVHEIEKHSRQQKKALDERITNAKVKADASSAAAPDREAVEIR